MKDFRRAAHLFHPAFMQDHDLRSQSHRFVDIVCDIDERNPHSFLYGDDFVYEPGAGLPVHRRKRFIKKDYRRIGRQRASQSSALLLTSGHILWIPISHVFDLEQTQHRLRTFAARWARNTFVLYAVSDVLRRGHVREQRIILKDISDASLLNRQVCAPGRIEIDLFPNADSPAVRSDNPRDGPESGRFSRT